MFQSSKTDIYLSEFAELCETFAEVNISWNDFWEVNGEFDFVHLHWPEYYFSWKMPTLEGLENIKTVLSNWRIKSTIVITRHNYHPHSGSDEAFEELYKIFYRSAHVIHHLGLFSQKEFEERYKGEKFLDSLQHHIIPHHYFYSYPSTITREDARKLLGITNDKLVMLAFGNIRKMKEQKLIAKAFSQLKAKNKLLLVPRWSSNHTNKLNSIIENLNIFGIYYFRQLWQKRFVLKTGFLKNEEIQLYFKAADFVFISRIDTLNSGIPYLHSQFRLPMIGPGIGNITESLKMINGLTFNPDNPQDICNVMNEIITTKINSGLTLNNNSIIESLKNMFSKYLKRHKLFNE